MDKQHELKHILEVSKDIGDSKYLGLPSLIGRSKKTIFRYLKDKVYQKIQGWSSKLLSQTIPSYTMSCFLIPKTLCQEIERLMNAYWWKSSSSNSKGIRWLAWEKMSMSKKRGGLGFRDLHGFNLALLGKQCWNLIHKPQALVSKVLKARYYPDCHLLDAKRKGGSSYTWSGIWEAKEEIKKGLRWVLGDGHTINISSDRWLRGKEEVITDQLSTTGGRSAKVCDFFSEDRKSWNEAKVRVHFNTEDAQAILDTRIPQVCTKDRIAWLHSPNGQYTVKTGYQQWHKNHIGDLGLQHSKGWNKIWNMKVPHKIKFFLWRICRNNLPIRILLRWRGVGVPIACAQCVGEVEHLLHLFFDCQFARDCWQKVGLNYTMWEVDNAPDWLLDKLCNETADNVIKIATVL